MVAQLIASVGTIQGTDEELVHQNQKRPMESSALSTHLKYRRPSGVEPSFPQRLASLSWPILSTVENRCNTDSCERSTYLLDREPIDLAVHVWKYHIHRVQYRPGEQGP